MGTHLFVSDVHLCQDRPHTTEAFLAFLRTRACCAESLYILGDLFEYWVGDDDLSDPFAKGIASALADLAGQQVRVYLMHGNRDFLLSSQFAQQAQVSLIGDPTCIEVHGQTVLLLHGDSLCTDDLSYLRFRQTVRDTNWQAAFLDQPLAERRHYAAGLRAQSEMAKSGKSSEIMDINPAALIQLLRDWHYPLIIHGHTHRPACHQLTLDGTVIQRFVLPDWYGPGGYLAADTTGFHLHLL